MYFPFQHEISNNLWERISKNYDNENYTGAILDAIFFLTKTIRDRTGFELDGVSLIGKVFGGKDPILKINKFQTESEKNEQKGIENILRGLFQAVRNPRAHEKIVDNKKTCDVLIVFIDYLLSLIEKSKAKFEIEDFFKRVIDIDFVESHDYAELLVSEIPANKIFDTLLFLLERRDFTKPNSFYYVIQAFLKRFNGEQKKEFFKIVSDILKNSDDDKDFKLFTTALKDGNWTSLELVARMRAENKLLRSFEEGIYDSNKNACKSGALGTWLSNIANDIKLKGEFRDLLIKKLSSNNYDEIEYIMRYFRNYIFSFEKEPEDSLINAINKGLKNGDVRFYDLISAEFFTLLDSKLFEKIKENYKNFEEKNLNSYTYDEDNLPF